MKMYRRFRFRRIHLDAIETQRLLQRRPDLRVATFSDIEVVALATRKRSGPSEFFAKTPALTGSSRYWRAT